MALVPTDILQNNIADIVKVERTHTKIPSDVQSYAANGARAYFKIPSDYLVDFRRSYFSMRALLLIGGNSFVQLPYPIQSLFSRFQVFCGSTCLADTQDQGVLQGLFKVRSQYNSVINKTEDGFYTAAQNRTQSILGTQYLFRFNYQILERIWPLQSIGSGGCYFVLTFDQLANSCVYDVAAPTGIFDRFEFNYSVIKPTSEVMQLVDGLINSGGYKIKYWSWESQLATVLSSTANTSVLSFKHEVCRGLVTASRLATSETGGALNLSYVLGYPQANVSQAQLRLGAINWPQNAYDMSVVAADFGYNAVLLDTRTFFEFMFDSHSRQGDDFGSMASTAVSNEPNAFMMCFDMRRDDTSNAWNNGYSTNTNSGDFILYTNWASAPGNLVQHNYICFAATVTVRQGGGGVIFEQ